LELLNYIQNLIFNQKFATPPKVSPGAPRTPPCYATASTQDVSVGSGHEMTDFQTLIGWI